MEQVPEELADREWREVPGWEGRYFVSRRGEVLSVSRGAPMLRSLCLSSSGYYVVPFSLRGRKDTPLVHRLVMEAFVGPCPEGMEVRHLDGDPLNNHLSNLKYGTPSENNRDKARHGTDHNKNKTHCPQGHPYDDENTYVNPRHGGRQCRKCLRMHYLRRKAKEGRGPDPRNTKAVSLSGAQP